VLRTPSSAGNKESSLGNLFSKASAQVGRVAVRSVDYVVEHRMADAHAMVARARARDGRSELSVSLTSAAIVRRISREMATVGAFSGAVAIAPAVGTTAALATSAADVGVVFARIATMVMAIGIAHDVDLSTVDLRRQHVYAVLGGAESALTSTERKAGEMKKMLGKKAVGVRTSLPAVSRVNDIVASRVGEKIIEKLVAKEATIAMATLLPLGIGAGIGAVGNRALVTSVGRTASKYFGAESTEHRKAPKRRLLAVRSGS
jgi:hypothetical protein